METKFIGDVHGLFKSYLELTKDCGNSIQVGDMGLGFNKWEDSLIKRKLDKIGGSHRFIRGNHDDPSVCKSTKQYITDGFVEDGIMYIGGAWSIDRAYRTENVNWWSNEELSLKRLNECFEIYKAEKPNIMVTHTAPYEIAQAMGFQMTGENRMEKAFSKMLHHHTPKLWVFGHWHKSFDYNLNGCRFICLDELETININLDDYNGSA